MLCEGRDCVLLALDFSEIPGGRRHRLPRRTRRAGLRDAA